LGLDLRDGADLFPAQRMEHDDLVHAVDELGAEVLGDDVHYGAFHLRVSLLGRSRLPASRDTRTSLYVARHHFLNRV
jgi:hypothetical protein